MVDERNLTGYVRHMLKNYVKYFGRDGVLNSDGRRLLNEIVREIMANKPELTKLARKVRKNPTIDNFMKLAERILGFEAHTLLEDSINNYLP